MSLIGTKLKCGDVDKTLGHARGRPIHEKLRVIHEDVRAIRFSPDFRNHLTVRTLLVSAPSHRPAPIPRSPDSAGFAVRNHLTSAGLGAARPASGNLYSRLNPRNTSL